MSWFLCCGSWVGVSDVYLAVCAISVLLILMVIGGGCCVFARPWSVCWCCWLFFFVGVVVFWSVCLFLFVGFLPTFYLWVSG